MKQNANFYGGIFFAIFVAIWLTVLPVNFMRTTHFGTFRFTVRELFGLQDRTNDVQLEMQIFSYEYKFPCVYFYGISGYTKINLVTHYGKIEKVVNMGYYNTLPQNTYESTEKSLDELREMYGRTLLIRSSIADMKEKDKIIFAKLKEQGKDDYELHKKIWRKVFFEPKYLEWWDGLDQLNHELEAAHGDESK